ncbi:hypothetical protein ACFWRC_19640 [Streptomyces albidoflavus]
MGVFDGGMYRLEIRDSDDEETTEYVGTEPEARARVGALKEANAKAAHVGYVHFVASDYDPGLSFGDFWGDEEDEDDEEG